MKKRIVRITAALCAAALLAGCGSSIGSKDGGYYATEAAAAVRDYWFGMVGAPWLAGFHASQNVASSRVLAKTGFHYDHDTVLHRFDGTEVPCLAWYLLNPGSQKSDEPAAAAPAVQAEPTEPAENAETTV